MKEKLIGDTEYGFRVKIDDDKNVKMIEIEYGVETEASEIVIPKDLMYLILNNFVKTDFV